MQVQLVQSSATAQTQPGYQSVLIIVVNGFIYLGYPNGMIFKAAGQSTALLQSAPAASLGYLNGHVYITTGGQTPADLEVQNLQAQVMVATAGTLPTFCSILATWRGRLEFAGDANNPQNVYMSRSGTATDYNYGATDTAAAVALNLSTAGRIGEPITALIPYTDDYQLYGCIHTIWMSQGDPAAGGSIVNVSQNVGILGKDAWCVDPDGTLFYVASGGLYSVRPIWEFYRPPESLTNQSYNQYFTALNPGTTRIQLVQDPELHYLHLYATPIDDATLGTHLTFDQRNGGLWPQQFPINIGPTCSYLYLADASSNQRAILLGGWDGYIRKLALGTQAIDDDGTAITPSVTMGAFSPFPDAAILVGTTIDMGEVQASQQPEFGSQDDTFTGDGTTVNFTLTQIPANTGFIPGEGPIVNAQPFSLSVAGVTNPIQGVDYVVFQISGNTYGIAWQDNTPPSNGAAIAASYQSVLGAQFWNANATVNVGPDAYSVTEGTPHNSFTVAMPLDRRQKTFRQRLRGRWFSVTLTNGVDDTYFAFESAVMEFIPGGKMREIR